MRLVRAIAPVALLAVLTARSVYAQPPPEPEEGRLHLGESVSITPAMSLVAGYDTNLIRTDTGEGGQDIHVVPQLEGWIGRGRIRLYIVSAFEYGDQETAGSQFNHFNSARFTSDGPRVSFAAQASHRNHYAPPTDYVGFEIGLKSRRIEDNLEGSVGLSPGGRVNFSVIGRYGQLRYDADAVYQGVSLQDSLNRNLTSFEGVAQMVLTPMSSLQVSGGPFYDRFINAPERDGNGYRAYVGGQFNPRALVSGRALVGLMHFETQSTGRTYTGPTYNIGLTTSKGPVLIDVTGSRIVDYSFDNTQGFYISSSLDTFIGVRTQSGWDLMGRGTFVHCLPKAC